MPDRTEDPDIEAARAHLDAARTALIEADSPSEGQNVEELAGLALAHAEVAKLALLIRSEERQEETLRRALQALDDEAFLALAVARVPSGVIGGVRWEEVTADSAGDSRFWGLAQSWLSSWLSGADEHCRFAWAEQATARVWQATGVWLLGWSDDREFLAATRQLYQDTYLTEA